MDRTNNFTVIYSFKLKEGKETEFIANWSDLTDLIYKQRGSLGSSLQKINENQYTAYAMWPNKETFEQIYQGESETLFEEIREKQKSCIEEVTILNQSYIVVDKIKRNVFKKNAMNTIDSKLNRLLASYQLHYQNLRSLHWNIKGNNFFELHLKYEELYTRTQVIIDDLAERILALNYTPLSSFTAYIEDSLIEENALISDGKTGVAYLSKAQNTLLEQEKVILELCQQSNDEGTASLMSDLIREKEKTNWMFRAYLA